GETTFVTIPVGSHNETWPVRAKGFARWLTRQFYAMTGKPPSSQALKDAVATLEARARIGGGAHDVHVRVAGWAGRIYLDLVNDKCEAIEVDASRWRVISNPPVKFRRAKGMLPLPTPVKGGSLDELRRFVNVKSDDQLVLILGWLVAALRPD